MRLHLPRANSAGGTFRLECWQLMTQPATQQFAACHAFVPAYLGDLTLVVHCLPGAQHASHGCIDVHTLFEAAGSFHQANFRPHGRSHLVLCSSAKFQSDSCDLHVTNPSHLPANSAHHPKNCIKQLSHTMQMWMHLQQMATDGNAEW